MATKKYNQLSWNALSPMKPSGPVCENSSLPYTIWTRHLCYSMCLCVGLIQSSWFMCLLPLLDCHLLESKNCASVVDILYFLF